MIPVKGNGQLQPGLGSSDSNGTSRVVVKRTVVTPSFPSNSTKQAVQMPIAKSTVQVVRTAPKVSAQSISIIRPSQGSEIGVRADPSRSAVASVTKEGVRSLPLREARTYEAGATGSIQRTPSPMNPTALELPSRLGAPTQGRSPRSPLQSATPPPSASESGNRQRATPLTSASLPSAPTGSSLQPSARTDQTPTSARPTLQTKGIGTINERRRLSGNATSLPTPPPPELIIPTPPPSYGAAGSVAKPAPRSPTVPATTTPPASAAGRPLGFDMPIRRSNSPRLLAGPIGAKPALKSPTAAGVARPAQSNSLMAPRVAFPSSEPEARRVSPGMTRPGAAQFSSLPSAPTAPTSFTPSPPRAPLSSLQTEPHPVAPPPEPAQLPPAMPPSALAQPNKPKTEKPKKVLQINSDKQDEPIKRMGEDEQDLNRRPSVFNFSDKGTVVAACPLCGSSYVDGATPCILQCNHTFCSACIEKMVANSKAACPRCKKCTELGEQGVAGLPRNYALTALAEINIQDLQRHSTLFLIESLDASCPICLETYGADRTPLTLGCGHTACDGCVMLLAEKAGSETLECPTCREKFVLDGISANLDLKKTIEAVRLLRKQAQNQAIKKGSA
eukprot:EG_transcript_5782